MAGTRWGTPASPGALLHGQQFNGIAPSSGRSGYPPRRRRRSFHVDIFHGNPAGKPGRRLWPACKRRPPSRSLAGSASAKPRAWPPPGPPGSCCLPGPCGLKYSWWYVDNADYLFNAGWPPGGALKDGSRNAAPDAGLVVDPGLVALGLSRSSVPCRAISPVGGNHILARRKASRI